MVLLHKQSLLTIGQPSAGLQDKVLPSVARKQGVNAKGPLGNVVTPHTYCPVPSSDALLSPAPSTPHPARDWAWFLSLQGSPLGHPPPTALS